MFDIRLNIVLYDVRIGSVVFALISILPGSILWPSGRSRTAAVREIERGLIDAKLGGFLLKKRLAKDHKGKSGGVRTILAYRHADRLIFLFGFAKRERASIDETEKKALLELAAVYMAMSEQELNEAIKMAKLLEVPCNDEEENEEPNSR